MKLKEWASHEQVEWSDNLHLFADLVYGGDDCGRRKEARVEGVVPIVWRWFVWEASPHESVAHYKVYREVIHTHVDPVKRVSPRIMATLLSRVSKSSPCAGVGIVSKDGTVWRISSVVRGSVLAEKGIPAEERTWRIDYLPDHEVRDIVFGVKRPYRHLQSRSDRRRK